MRMILKPLALAGIFYFASTTLSAQKLKPALKEVPLHSLDAFRTPYGNWQVVGNLHAAYDDTLLKTDPGVGVLYNNFTKSSQFKPGHELTTKLEHGDLVLELDVMVPKGSNSGIYLQSRYEVQIYDSWRRKSPRHSDMGGIYERWKDDKGYEGKSPLSNAAFAPGLWQHVEISFRAPRFDASGKKISFAKFNYVKLNGVIIHEDILLTGPTRSATFEDERALGPLMIQGDHGPVAIRNLKIALQEDLDVSTSNVVYRYYEKTANTPEEAVKIKPTTEGKVSSIDVRVAPSREEFFIIYEGKINVPLRDEYDFSLLGSGTVSLEIDGKTFIAPARSSIQADPLRARVDLEKGSHDFKLWLNKANRWQAPALALYVEKAGSRAVPLHALVSVPEITPPPLYTVKAEQNTEIIRSFMDHKGKKLTHVVSVGDPAGINYSYDLLQGALLQVWRGDFLNTTEMWHERGEPQTAEPLGASVVLPGNCPIFDAELSKDSVAEYIYKGYSLASNGAPVFSYEYRGLKVSDKVIPADQEKGLNRTLHVSGEGKDKIQLRIAQAGKIRMVRNGLYNIDEGRYFVEVQKGSAVIVNYLGNQVLLLNAADPVSYQIIW